MILFYFKSQIILIFKLIIHCIYPKTKGQLCILRLNFPDNYFLLRVWTQFPLKTLHDWLFVGKHRVNQPPRCRIVILFPLAQPDFLLCQPELVIIVEQCRFLLLDAEPDILVQVFFFDHFEFEFQKRPRVKLESHKAVGPCIDHVDFGDESKR